MDILSIRDRVKEDHCETAGGLSKNRTKWVFLCGIDCITNFPYNKRLVVIFTIFRYAKELYKFIEGTRVSRKTDHNTLASIERHWIKEVIEKGGSVELASISIKTNIYIQFFSYE